MRASSTPEVQRKGIDLQLSESVVVVTGASNGIGLAVTRAFVTEGARMIAGARMIDSLRRMDRVIPVAVDLTSPR